MQVCHSHLNDNGCMVWLGFGDSNFELLMTVWTGSKRNLSAGGEKFGEADGFSYLDNRISAGGPISNEVSSCLHITRLTLVDLRHLWRWRETYLPIKNRVCTTALRLVLLYSPET